MGFETYNPITLNVLVGTSDLFDSIIHTLLIPASTNHRYLMLPCTWPSSINPWVGRISATMLCFSVCTIVPEHGDTNPTKNGTRHERPPDAPFLFISIRTADIVSLPMCVCVRFFAPSQKLSHSFYGYPSHACSLPQGINASSAMNFRALRGFTRPSHFIVYGKCGRHHPHNLSGERNCVRTTINYTDHDTSWFDI